MISCHARVKSASLSWSTYVRHGLGRRLSRLGERLGIHGLIYNPLLFRHFHEMAVASAPPVIDVIAGQYPQARFYADVGAGSGAYAAEAARRGLGVVACEHSPTGRRWAVRQGVDCRPFDLTREPPAAMPTGIDLSYCFEVAEHLPPELGDRLVRFLAELSPIVIFTAARPGQGGTGHLNEQPKAYWIERFTRSGMRHVPDESQALAEGFARRAVPSTWLIENVLVFRRSA